MTARILLIFNIISALISFLHFASLKLPKIQMTYLFLNQTLKPSFDALTKAGNSKYFWKAWSVKGGRIVFPLTNELALKTLLNKVLTELRLEVSLLKFEASLRTGIQGESSGYW